MKVSTREMKKVKLWKNKLNDMSFYWVGLLDKKKKGNERNEKKRVSNERESLSMHKM